MQCQTLLGSNTVLASWIRVFLKKARFTYLVKKLSVFQGSRRFTILFTRAPRSTIPESVDCILHPQTYLFRAYFNIIVVYGYFIQVFLFFN